MRKSEIKLIPLYRDVFHGNYSCPVLGSSAALMAWQGMWRTLFGLFSAIAMVMLVGCSGGGGGASSTQAPAVTPTGSIMFTGRTKPLSTTLTPGTATPDGVAITIDDLAISTDGDSYETIVTGPTVPDIDAQMRPIIGEKGGLATGDYKSIKLTSSKIDWHVDWNFSNPSPCDGATTGSTSGSLDLSATPTIYFKTADLGGNTLYHYQSNMYL